MQPAPAEVMAFDQYLGVACPNCSGRFRILGGRCANCESDTCYVVWHGDKSVRSVKPAGGGGFAGLVAAEERLAAAREKSSGDKAVSARGAPSTAAKPEQSGAPQTATVATNKQRKWWQFWK